MAAFFFIIYKGISLLFPLFVFLLCNYNFKDQFYFVRKEVKAMFRIIPRTIVIFYYLILQIVRTSGAEDQQLFVYGLYANILRDY